MPKKGENKHTRAHQECKRCGYTRAELSNGMWERRGVTGVAFTNGHCPSCYALLRQYWFDEELADCHELTQEIRKLDLDRRHKWPQILRILLT